MNYLLVFNVEVVIKHKTQRFIANEVRLNIAGVCLLQLLTRSQLHLDVVLLVFQMFIGDFFLHSELLLTEFRSRLPLVLLHLFESRELLLNFFTLLHELLMHFECFVLIRLLGGFARYLFDLR